MLSGKYLRDVWLASFRKLSLELAVVSSNTATPLGKAIAAVVMTASTARHFGRRTSAGLFCFLNSGEPFRLNCNQGLCRVLSVLLRSQQRGDPRLRLA